VLREKQLSTMSDEPSEVTPPSTRASTPPSFPEPQIISSSITFQAPLSRRGTGPEKCLDPPPLQKWAEEGFAVVQLLVPGKPDDGGEFPLEKALETLKGCEACEFEKGVGLICK
jgi:carboxymethylenebutenolidase